MITKGDLLVPTLTDGIKMSEDKGEGKKVSSRLLLTLRNASFFLSKK